MEVDVELRKLVEMLRRVRHAYFPHRIVQKA
jgi:hypothetical protein